MNRLALDRLHSFGATAERAELSRDKGGYGILTDTKAGLDVGRQIADWNRPKYRVYFDETAQVRD